MRNTGIQGDRNPKGTYLDKDALMLKMARRRAERPMTRMAKIETKFPRTLRK